MKKQRYIRRVAWGLWLTYLCVNIPFVILHHHHFSITDEKYAYRANDDIDSQVATFQEYCFFCDHHFIQEYKPVIFKFKAPVTETILKLPFIRLHFYGRDILIHRLNKDPPHFV